MILSAARTNLLDHLDDDGTRWAQAAQDRALGWALSACLSDYIAAGGDRFNKVGTFTSTTAGVVDMSSVPPIAVRKVAVKVGTRIFPIPEVPLDQREFDDVAARTVEVTYAQMYALPTDAAHPLVGAGATAANSWEAFDHWICVRAALFCLVKDAEQRPELLALEQNMRDSILVFPKIPRQVPFPRAGGHYSQILGYCFRHDNQDIVLVRRGVWS